MPTPIRASDPGLDLALMLNMIEESRRIRDNSNNNNNNNNNNNMCIDNSLIDKVLLEDATKNAKNISCVWIDVKKAFDSVAHNWLVTVLKDHGVNRKLVCFIEKITKLWKTTMIVPTEKGTERVGPIRIQRGILQGYSFCVNLFTLCINPIAWVLRATEGYTFSHDKTSKITQTLFVDDLKSYHENAVKAATIASNLESMFEDDGLHWV